MLLEWDCQIRESLGLFLLHWSPSVEADREVQSIQKIIQERVFSPSLNVNVVLKAAGIGDHNAQTRYREATGETIFRTITRCRIDAAAHLLRHTDAPSYLIGQAVGYRSAETFGRAFKRTRGIPPGEYRRTVPINPARKVE